MKRFDVAALQEGDILCGRGSSRINKLIQGILGSVTDHSAPIIKHNTKGWGVGDTTPPASVFRPLSFYEEKINAGYFVRILRIKDATEVERHRMSFVWQRFIDGLEYSEASVARLWVYRIVNSLPWHIHGHWCTRAIGVVCSYVFPPARNMFRKLFVAGMPLKKNETPRTIENRLMQGVLEDVTDQVLVEENG